MQLKIVSARNTRRYTINLAALIQICWTKIPVGNMNFSEIVVHSPTLCAHYRWKIHVNKTKKFLSVHKHFYFYLFSYQSLLRIYALTFWCEYFRFQAICQLPRIQWGISRCIVKCCFRFKWFYLTDRLWRSKILEF